MQRLSFFLKTAASRLWRMPFRLCLLVTLLLHSVGEEYPFSNFPMYSNFQREARVVWVSDENGDPVPTNDYFGRRTSTIKKIFDTRISEGRREAKRADAPVPTNDEVAPAAAARVLEDLWKGRRGDKLEKSGVAELRFMERVIRFEGDRFVESEVQLASMPVPDLAEE